MDTNIIYNEDCLSVLQRLPDASINLILQDPPYNQTACSWEYDIFQRIDDLWSEWKRVLVPGGVIAMTGSQPFTSRLVMSNLDWFKYEWIWEKTNATGHLNSKKQPMRCHENVLVFYQSQPTYNPQKTQGHERKVSLSRHKEAVAVETQVYREHTNYVDYDSTERYPRTVQVFASDKQLCSISPTQKPTALFEYLIKTYTNEGDIVFDGYAGSCTTAVACINTDRKYICCELDKSYYLKSLNRLGIGLQLS